LIKYRMVLAVLAGAGFAASITLLVNAPGSLSPFVALIFLMPGSLLASRLFRSDGLGPPLAVLAASALVYSTIAYVSFALWLRSANLRKLKSLTLYLSGPALGLVGLACVPSLNPLWPQGMAQLAETENALREGLPKGASLERSRAFLQARGVKLYEEKLTVQQVVLERGDTKLVAHPGDQLVSARIATNAGQFPCGYAIEVLLIFDASKNLEQNHIDRLRICP